VAPTAYAGGGGGASPINCFPEKRTFKIKTYFPV
jgi:hypothetical protein